MPSRLSSSIAYGARCNCPANIRGDYCQYTSAKSIQTLPQIEYRQFDAETLAAIAGLGSSSASSHASNHRSNSIAIAVGNRSQFVFCLTNPCENDGTCFVTNAATTKVRLEMDLTLMFDMGEGDRPTDRLTRRLLSFVLGNMCLSRRLHR